MKIGVNGRTLASNVTGLGRYVIEMCRSLAAAGHHVVIYLPSDPPNPLPQLDNVDYRIGNASGTLKRNIWAQTTLPKSAKADGLDVFWGPAHRLPHFLSSEIPRVVTIHDLVWVDAGETMRLRSWLGDRLLMKPALRSADRIVADSYSTAKQIERHFPGLGKIEVIYPGLTSLPAASQSTILQSNRIDREYALFVGTLEPRKNLPNLLLAYASLPQNVRDNLLMVVAGGAGWKLPDLARRIGELRLEKDVRLTGYVADADLRTLYENARFLAMPSLYEGFGFPIIEANSLGIPVLTSNISSMPEVGGKAAFLVNPFDVSSVADGLKRLGTETILLERLATEARTNAQRFNWGKSSEKLAGVFEAAIGLRRDRLGA
ncbi:glycosyltransferase family 1 protein (plasmid) [Rhizobium sp. CB3090]|uniref:glycosyltransferase family 4 protein n=1 Tax=Rhizobium sp. CB3090 TaxID=3039156 RepID=UPI0024B07205|nr:glycosyltransferase family 1 protein [Rhizobium sp. CB3090]WFU12161.1 glycosyltransferase family 1 protein [Rhizobium sp. CB3090]